MEKKKKTFSDEIWILSLKMKKKITFSNEIKISSLFVDQKQGRQNEKWGSEFN